MIPISGSVLSVLILPNEQFTGAILFALLLVAGGLVIVNYRQKEQAAEIAP